ncbi:MAG: ribulose-phosphate 3-epimerase, partial [bacterium]|nr:ribulose-phosphate 3-epimerase [bacterium]
LASLSDMLRVLDQDGVSSYHLDVMDGQFVPNITFGPCVVRSIRSHTSSRLDVHLMIVKPERFIEQFVEAGADTIILHVESCTNLRQTMEQIKDLGAGAGITLNPDTPLKTVEPVIDIASMLLIMSVFPGFSGQSFIPESVDKSRAAAEMIERLNPACRLAVDGGVSCQNAGELARAGADTLIAASSVFNTDIPPRDAVKRLLACIAEG